MADAGDLKSPARYGRVGSNPTSAITEDRKQRTEDREKTVIKSVKDCMYITIVCILRRMSTRGRIMDMTKSMLCFIV